MKEENKRKGIIYLTIGVVTLLVLVAGAAFAYFQAQVGNGTSFDVNATTGTTDVLSFLMSDIDVSKENENIVDNHNRTEGLENEDIVINASQDNFGEKDKSLGDGVSAKAILKANNTNNIASATYNVFFVIDTNDLTYTQGTEYPELIMTVIDPNGDEVKTIDGLKYHEKDESNPNDVSGFDITGKTNGFAIKRGQKIEVEKNNSNHQTEQEWKIKVTLVNLKENQNENTGKEITGEVVITQEEIETYKLNKIKNVKVDNKTTSSITTTLELEEKPTNEAVEYYFAKEEKGRVSTVSLEELVWEKEEGPTHTFRELKSDTNYIIYSYVVDSEGFRSNTYKTELIATNKTLPEITSLEVKEKSYNEISIKIESEEGDRGIKEYEYEISGATIEGSIIETSQNKTYTFTNLSEQQQYTIKVRAVDNDGDKSTDEVTTGETRESYYHETCNDGSGACKIAKLSINNNFIIFHEGLPDYEEMPNSNLEAEDLSYRYVGSNFKLVGNGVSYQNIDNDLIKYNCDGEEIKLTSYCAKPDRYYYLAYESNTHFSNYYEVVDKALKDGYIEYNLKNYVCFGSDDCSEKQNYDSLYRIIGVFKNNDTNNYEIKLIKADYATIDELGTDGAFDQNFNYGFNANRSRQLNNKFGQYFWNSNTELSNDWTKSNLNKTNLNTNFINYLNKIDSKWSLYINNHNWKLSAIENTNLTPKEAYNLEFNNFLETTETKIGILYLSEYGYSNSPEIWQKIFWDYPDNNFMSWLYMGNHEWTMSKSSSFEEGVINILSAGDSSGAYVQISAYPIRQTFYLKPEVKILSGEGTISNPYRLAIG